MNKLINLRLLLRRLWPSWRALIGDVLHVFVLSGFIFLFFVIFITFGEPLE